MSAAPWPSGIDVRKMVDLGGNVDPVERLLDLAGISWEQVAADFRAGRRLDRSRRTLEAEMSHWLAGYVHGVRAMVREFAREATP